MTSHLFPQSAVYTGNYMDDSPDWNGSQDELLSASTTGGDGGGGEEMKTTSISFDKQGKG